MKFSNLDIPSIFSILQFSIYLNSARSHIKVIKLISIWHLTKKFVSCLDARQVCLDLLLYYPILYSMSRGVGRRNSRGGGSF